MFRTRIAKDIVCEFLPPARKIKKTKVIIYAPGFPSSPSKNTLAEFYSKKGFWVFIPRYRGAWESGGELLRNEPTEDIKDVIDAIYKGFKDIPFSAIQKPTTFKLNPDSLLLIGCSFGGPAMLLNSKDPRVTKVICLSPVVDWKNPSRVERAKWFWPFVNEAYGEAFRINKEGIKKLYKTNFYNPSKQLEKIDGSRITIFHANNDEVVLPEPVIKFANATESRLVLLKKGGHLTSRFLLGKKYLRILNYK